MSDPQQLSLIHAQFDPSIRRVTMDGVEYFSCVDIMAVFVGDSGAYWQSGERKGQKKVLSSDPRVIWGYVKKRLDEEGFNRQEKIIQLKLQARDGKMRLTDCADGQTIVRIIQSIPSPKVEPLRQWLAELGYRALEEAANPELAVRRRRAELARLEKAGYGNHPDTQRLRDRDANIEVYKSLKATIGQVCENPNWGRLANAEYLAMFGEIASQLQIILGTKSVRDSLPSQQLTALTYAERTLQLVLARQETLTNAQIEQLIDYTVRPIGEHLRAICDALGIHHISGKPLLEEKNS